MASELCIQGRYQVVDVCNSRFARDCYCIIYGKLPGHKSIGSKPGEELENGMIFCEMTNGRIGFMNQIIN
jgi:hypothetical protein